ncbi:MAG: D-2-hydroxyacid dehydrogenase [Lachnospiraceae bacterium]|nr:D-2-hydroxyacid dehydrogenase [Candidatus Equihabitans merdae]
MNNEKKKLAILVPGFESHIDQVRAMVPDWDIVQGDESNFDDWADVDVLFGDPSLSVIKKMSKLDWLQICWAGYNDYVEDGHLPEGIKLCNASGAYGVTIAEHGLGMLLALCRRLPAYQKNKDQQVWQDMGSEKMLYGGTALVLGCGDLGSQMALRLKAFGMHVIGAQRTPKSDLAPFDLRIALKDVEKYLPQADVVIGCLPDNPETHHTLSEERLSLMKEDAIIVNVGRGGLIDTDALMECLDSGKFFGVGLDVIDPEPLPEGHALWNMDRVIITPHVAGTGFGHLKEVEELIWNIFLNNLPRYVSGEVLNNLVTVI